jgi:hypothetical protein
MISSRSPSLQSHWCDEMKEGAVVAAMSMLRIICENLAMPA